MNSVAVRRGTRTEDRRKEKQDQYKRDRKKGRPPQGNIRKYSVEAEKGEGVSDDMDGSGTSTEYCMSWIGFLFPLVSIKIGYETAVLGSLGWHVSPNFPSMRASRLDTVRVYHIPKTVRRGVNDGRYRYRLSHKVLVEDPTGHEILPRPWVRVGRSGRDRFDRAELDRVQKGASHDGLVNQSCMTFRTFALHPMQRCYSVQVLRMSTYQYFSALGESCLWDDEATSTMPSRIKLEPVWIWPHGGIGWKCHPIRVPASTRS
ncbi:hypothetical protein V8C37DRAFT_256994 [Trichoderma ceciliae]